LDGEAFAPALRYAMQGSEREGDSPPSSLIELGKARQLAPGRAEIEHRLAGDQDQVGTVDAFGRGAAARVGPGQERAVGIGGVDRGEDPDRVRAEALDRGLLDPGAAQPIDRAVQGELGARQPSDEIAPADLAALFHLFEDAIERTEPARDALGLHRLAADHAVALEQDAGAGEQALGVACADAQIGHARPAPAGQRGAAASPGARVRPRARAGGEGVVGDLAGPDQIPERGLEGVLAELQPGALDRLHQLHQEGGTPGSQMVEQDPADVAGVLRRYRALRGIRDRLRGRPGPPCAWLLRPTRLLVSTPSSGLPRR
jgi:hypothetical protein